MLESKSQAEMLLLLWAVCPAGGWFGLHDVFFVCSGGWQTWNLSNLLQSFEVGPVYMMSSLVSRCKILHLPYMA